MTLELNIVQNFEPHRWSYAYGSLTNETVIGGAGTNTIVRKWDNFGRTTGYTLNPDNPVNPVQVSYSYDGLGHFASVDFNAEAQSGRVEYGYLPGTDIVSGYASGDFSRSVAYEAQRDLIAAVTNSFVNSSTLQPFNLSTFTYANDAAGRRVSRLDSFDGAATANTFGYNARSEVVSALMGTNSYGYAYDPIGNRITSYHNAATNLYTANALNQYTSISDLCDLCVLCGSNNVPFHYDADGNMTADERGWHYFWNGENRMICASNADVIVTYAYDHRGRMVRREVARTTNSPFSILNSTFVWDGWNIIHETTTNLSTFQPFNLSTSYVWGLDIDGTLQGAGGVGGLLAVIHSNSPTPNSTTYQLYLPTYDANGNITEYVATNGTVAAHYEYSAFGDPVVTAGELTATFTHQFSTKPYCATTGFSEYVYRKYRPNIGRWMSRDPIGEMAFFSQFTCEMEKQSVLNFLMRSFAPSYSFVDNSPVNFLDEIGLKYGNPVSGPDGPVGPATPYDPGGPYNPRPNQGSPWYANLPECPCNIPLDGNGCPVVDDTNPGWTSPTKTGHKGGTWEIRKTDPSISAAGQQCVYDSSGKLINQGPAAGTPDMVSPSNSFLGHVLFDGWQWLFGTDYDHTTHPPNQGKDQYGNPCEKNDGAASPPPDKPCCR